MLLGWWHGSGGQVFVRVHDSVRSRHVPVQFGGHIHGWHFFKMPSYNLRLLSNIKCFFGILAWFSVGVENAVDMVLAW
jgi:hypothetical protein